MNQTAKSKFEENKQLLQKRYRKNEIICRCSSCQTEKLLAYWDAELEYYIYLSDEPSVCSHCMALESSPIMQKVSDKASKQISI